jgi:uncharacterized protein (DUF111 family)
MKKGRSGQLLLCPKSSDDLCRIVFEETTTIGLRRYTARRTALERSWFR